MSLPIEEKLLHDPWPADDGARREAAAIIRAQHELLVCLEWGDDDRPGCPFCGMSKKTGHLGRCQLDAALTLARGEER